MSEILATKKPIPKILEVISVRVSPLDVNFILLVRKNKVMLSGYLLN